MAENATEWFGMRVTPTQKEKIKRLAEREDTTLKTAVAHVQKSCTRTRAEMNAGVIRFRLIANSQIAT
jgi:hypothetical protein